jgi:glycosyltransferase involved in cell wall biosynthesis
VNLIQITPGAGGMYCGNCFRDNALVAALRRQGHDVVMVPLYLPMTLDEAATMGDTPTFFGGVNVYLSQKLPFHRHAPAWWRRLFDNRRMLKWAAGKAAKTRADQVGDLNVSMLRGEEGNQTRELDDLIGWLKTQPKPDAVLLSNALLAGFARKIRAELGTRVIVFLQSEESFLDSIPEPWRTQSWDLLAERGGDVDGWIAPSQYFAARMSERLGLPSSRVQVVYNGISLAGYPETKSTKPAGEPLVLGFFARMCPDKGLDLVVDAFLALRRRGGMPNLLLKVGGGCGPGDEPFVATQKAKIEAAGLSRDVSFHPNVTREEKIAFYASCDVLSVPSRQSEAFGLYIIESLAAGTPLVLPDSATFPELLKLTGGGIISGANHVTALADALHSLLLDTVKISKLGEQGRRAVRDRFTDDAMARDVVAATERVVRGAPLTHPLTSSKPN